MRQRVKETKGRTETEEKKNMKKEAMTLTEREKEGEKRGGVGWKYFEVCNRKTEKDGRKQAS